jgi:hypothetical protein
MPRWLVQLPSGLADGVAQQPDLGAGGHESIAQKCSLRAAAPLPQDGAVGRGLRSLRCGMASATCWPMGPVEQSSARPFGEKQARQSVWAADLPFWSPRSDSNRRPSDYESVPNPPPGPAQNHPGCSAADRFHLDPSCGAWYQRLGCQGGYQLSSVGAAWLPRFRSLSIRLRSDAHSQPATIGLRPGESALPQHRAVSRPRSARSTGWASIGWCPRPSRRSCRSRRSSTVGRPGSSRPPTWCPGSCRSN